MLCGAVWWQWSVALRAYRRGERRVGGLGVVSDPLHLLLDEPFSRRRHEPGSPAEIVLAVLVELVPTGVDDHHIARAHHISRRLLEVVIGDGLPLLLRHRHPHAAPDAIRPRP